MADILHQVGILKSKEDVFRALATLDGLSKWWTGDTTGSAAPGKIIQFRFNGMGPDFQVVDYLPFEKVKWLCVAGIEEWLGTEVSFGLESKGKETFVHFRHGLWKHATPFFAHCNTKWAVFLLSLKDYLETGHGKPFPHDIQINHK